jgi:uncharacterized protein (TIGR03382 family)
MKKWMVRLVVCAALLGSARAALAEVIWRGDFQTGDRTQWTSMEAVSTSRLQIVSTPVPDGYDYALETTVKQGDTVFGGDRSELDYETDRPREGDERYYHWKTYWPADYQTADYWQLFTQWHQYVSGGSPPLAFMAWGEKIQLGNDQDVYFWNAPLERGVWHDFVFHVIWSSSSSTGAIELWYDGQHELPLTHTATLFSGDTVCVKQGLYRKNLISWDQTVFHCGMTVATQLSDVMTSTTPADGGVEPTDAGTHSTDAGHPSSDAGTRAVDGGSSSADAGTVSTAKGSGGEVSDGPTPKQGCQSSGPATLAGLMLAAGLMMRRRKSARS